jgi:hypothetical protein
VIRCRATSLPVEADNEHHSELSNQWRKNMRKRSFFRHNDIILVEEAIVTRMAFMRT